MKLGLVWAMKFGQLFWQLINSVVLEAFMYKALCGYPSSMQRVLAAASKKVSTPS